MRSGECYDQGASGASCRLKHEMPPVDYNAAGTSNSATGNITSTLSYFDIDMSTLSLHHALIYHSQSNTLISTLSLHHTLTSTLSLYHSHFNTLTSTLSLQHSHFSI